MLQLVKELKSIVIVLHSHRKHLLALSLTVVCPPYASHLVKPRESFLTLVFYT